MTPILVTAPTAEVVTLAEIKDQLNITHSFQDVLLSGYVAAAVSHLDGWTGVLGRCIAPQEWRVTLDSPGTYTLPMPDVTEAEAAYDVGATALVVMPTACGPQIEVTEACDVTFTCQASATILPAIKQAVKLLAASYYENRTADHDKPKTHPAYDRIVAGLSWRKF